MGSPIDDRDQQLQAPFATHLLEKGILVSVLARSLQDNRPCEYTLSSLSRGCSVRLRHSLVASELHGAFLPFCLIRSSTIAASAVSFRVAAFISGGSSSQLVSTPTTAFCSALLALYSTGNRVSHTNLNSTGVCQ